jgi:hypothetical protein
VANKHGAGGKTHDPSILEADKRPSATARRSSRSAQHTTRNMQSDAQSDGGFADGSRKITISLGPALAN